MRNLALCVGLLFCAALGATAQDRTDAPSFQASTALGSPAATAGFAMTPWQLAFGYQYNRIDIPGVFKPFNTIGFSVSATRFFGQVLGIEGEAGSGLGYPSRGQPAEPIFVGVGPRLAHRTHSRFEPWAHGLAGPEYLNLGNAPFPGKKLVAAWILGGGLDYRFDSRFALRIQGDYLGSAFAGGLQRNIQVVTGIVWNF